MKTGRGPLQGLRVIELAGMGPGPFCAMVLADLGADVVRVERPRSVAAGPLDAPPADVAERGRAAIWELDLRSEGAVDELRAAVRTADVFLEGFRPGVAERMGLGPDVLRQGNPRLVYGRMTGWGQHGPLAHAAGHDINYIALSGVLHMIGEAGSRPVPPLNLIGDYGGGGMLLAVGVLAAVWHAERTGDGQVIDAAMIDGASLLASLFYGLEGAGRMSPGRGSNLLDGGAPFYRTYETADGAFMALGALEQRFFDEFTRLAGMEPVPEADRVDPQHWPELTERLSTLFRQRTRAEWTALFDGSDACCTPVLTLSEAGDHPHLAARATVVHHDGQRQPAPAPRFSSTPIVMRSRGDAMNPHTLLASWAGVDLEQEPT